MKPLSIFTSTLLISSTLFFTSCQKDIEDLSVSSFASSKANKIQTKVLKGHMTTQTSFYPDTQYNPGNLSVFAWYPGNGKGNLSGIGAFTVYYNQYVYPSTIPGSLEFALGNSASVNSYFGTELSDLLNVSIPDSIGTVIIDNKGNSFWSHGTYNYQIPYAGRIIVQGEFHIVGGTGIYENATGNFRISGYSDSATLQDPSEDQFEIDGEITFGGN